MNKVNQQLTSVGLYNRLGEVLRTHAFDVMCSCTAELLLTKYFLQMLKCNCGGLCGGRAL